MYYCILCRCLHDQNIEIDILFKSGFYMLEDGKNFPLGICKCKDLNQKAQNLINKT